MAKNRNLDLDNLSEEALDAQLARYTARPTDHQLAGGAPRELSWLMTIGGLIGVFASLMLIMSEKEKLTNPNAVLLCDVNPLIGCGKWIGTWQNEVFFGISNAVLGLAFFAGVAALGLALVTNGVFGTWLWRALTVGVVGGIVWVMWFAYQSYFVEGSLCPYCVLTWFVMIPLFVHVLARTLQAGHWGKGAMKAGSALTRNRWLIVGIIYAALIVFTIFYFWEKWALVF